MREMKRISQKKGCNYKSFVSKSTFLKNVDTNMLNESRIGLLLEKRELLSLNICYLQNEYDNIFNFI